MAAELINGWEVMARTNSRIISSDTMEAWEAELEITALPEMIFPDNVLRFQHESGFTLEFTAKAALQAARLRPGEVPEYSVHVQYAEEWQAKRQEEVTVKPHDQGVPWTFQTPYSGDAYKETGAGKIEVKAEDTVEEIDYEMLKDTTQPILWNAEVLLYEDELHDCGVSRVNLRARVMPNCFFILLRHWLRVDDVVSCVTDTRLWHPFGASYVIRECCVRELKLTKTPSCDQVDLPFRRHDNPDDHQSLMTTVKKTLQKIPMDA